MSKKTPKTEKILNIAIELLKHEGDFGITMRRVASLAEMSLSNVQYYFKNKDALLKAMADRYFQQCLSDIAGQPALSARAKLAPFVHTFLLHGHELSDMCRIFREYWALSTRNETIDAYLSDYYQTLASILADKLRPLAADESALTKAVSILLPYVEGYSVTAPSLPETLETMNTLVEKILWQCLQGEL